MNYDFDTVIDRKGTNSLKWDNIHNTGDVPDVLPLWVADMDFPVLPEVRDALIARVSHPIYGYTNLPKNYFHTVAEWHKTRYGRLVDTEQLLLAPSVMHALSMAVRTFTKPGDRILNLPPIYYPFYKVVHLNERELVEAPLKVAGNRWTLDKDEIEKVLRTCRDQGRPIRALLFSAPHNPTGRVWDKDELAFIERMATTYDFLVLSDEIHADLILGSNKHISLVDLPGLASRLLVFSGPNKTFNLAGLHICHVFAPDPNLRSRMRKAIEADFFDQPNVMSLTAATAAYSSGGRWLDQLLTYISENYQILDDFLNALSVQFRLKSPLHLYPLEATYLAWADFTDLINQQGFVDDKDFARHLEIQGRVKVSHGSIFQTGGKDHLRFNLATPKSILKEGLHRLEKCLKL